MLSSALSKLPNTKGLFIRRVGLPADILATYEKGETVTHNAFTSTTFNKKDVFDGEPVRMKIFGKTGKRIYLFSTLPEEKEVLFDKGTQFKVKDREQKPLDGIIITEITLEEV